MTQEELDIYCYRYATATLTPEEYMKIGGEKLCEIVKKNIDPIPKEALVAGQEYPGYCRNATKAVWDGQKFMYAHYECGFFVPQTIKHYEDDENDGTDVFVPVTGNLYD